ncbi:reverse transcriptase domain-containing protein [Tanacetum coccineum]
MPPKRNGISAAAIEQLITQRVVDALLTYEANRNNENGNGNGNDNGNGSHDLASGGRRTLHTARVCTYKEFLNCQPRNFKGNEGSVGLAYWFEKMESIFHISNCTVECQVKYATCTLLGGALTWWNSYVRAVGHDAAYEMTWKSLMKMMTEAYYPRSEIKKLEIELWNLMVKGTDVVSYTQRFQELALLCSRMVPREFDKVEKYVGGLLDNIQGNVMQANIKRRIDNNPKDNHVLQLPYKRQNVARAYTVGPSENKEYDGTLPLCNKCKLHYNGPCTVKCANYKKVGHMTRDSRSPTAVVDQRTLTCFECRNQGNYRSECPRLKNQNCRNQTGNSDARGRVYALRGGEDDQDPNNITDDIDA